MTLEELADNLDKVNDWLVDAENEFTHGGDMAEFNELHNHLTWMRDIVADLAWRMSEDAVRQGR